ncbi:hypothetical protein ACFFU8_09250 [Chromobacterium piscinae]|uniref:hypothetical protein n=1 Tax=Chromobacterium piscinae TaxID=686831 RepID=UPI001E4553D4|nr:hypothetical protein [Chromobacterium piscinae]MCD5327910.1 hypothetical protein [Chromobacterium piscinae]
MKTKIETSSRNILLILGLAAAAGVYYGDQQLRVTLDQSLLIVGGMPPINATHEDKLKQLYPLMATAPAKDPRILQPDVPGSTLAAPPGATNMDQIFEIRAAKSEASAAATEPAAPDYFALLQTNQLMKLDATAPGLGAFINGKYIALGHPIEQFAYPSGPGKAEIAPVLTVVSETSVLIAEPRGKRRIQLTMNK